MCKVFGDNPEAGFGILSERGFEQFDDDVDNLGVSGAKSWSFQLGYLAYGFLQFDSVTMESAGEYACRAELGQAGIVKIQTVTLRVLSHKEAPWA